MILRSISTLAIMLFALSTFAQSTISGVLKNKETNAPLAYASVALLNPTDSTIVKGTVTDDVGFFEIQQADGDYLLKLSYVTFIERIGTIAISGDRNLGDLLLEQDANEIEAVTVVGQKSETEFYLDKKVFTVGSDLTAVGTDAIDVLGNVPSVTTDVDGNVSLRGSEGVQILINGKQSGLTGLGGSNALKNIPANLIEKIEVITNPSARYDAQGQVGIINIVLKKQQAPGINGSIDLNIGTPEQYGTSFNLNYRHNKVNFFTSVGGRYRVRPGNGYADYKYFNPTNNIYSSVTDRDFERTGKSLNTTAGIEYFFQENQTLTGSFRYSKGKDDNSTDILYSDFDEFESLFSQSSRTDREDEDESDFAYNINYLYNINQETGKKFSFDIRYEETDELERNNFFEQQVFGSGFEPVTQIARNQEMQGEYLFQVDYVLPLTTTNKVEFGAKSTLRDIDTDFKVTQKDGNGEFQDVPGQNNQFQYDEDIVALYGIYASEFGERFSYQAGVRAEYADINTFLINTSEENPRDYLSFFPSAFLTYKTETDNSLQFSYSRRINRPGFWELNPFLTYSDPRRIFSGNPNLNPEFTNSFEMGYLKDWDNTTLNSSVYYRKTNDVISRLEIPIATDTVRLEPRNLDVNHSTGFEFLLNSDVNKWLTLDANFNIFYFKEEGRVNANDTEALETEDVSHFTRLTTRMKFTDSWDGQLRFFYRGPRNSIQGSREAIYTLDFGTGKEVLNNKGTVTFNVRDIFNTRKYESQVINDSYISNSEFRRGQTSLTLGFNYRINQNNKKRGGQGSQGGEDFGGSGDEF